MRKDFNLKKLYYSISEVSRITNIEQYILRYWETEFEQLKPQKNRAGNRSYSNKDIKLILFIKSLLRDKKYTIEGAKKILSELEEKDFDSLEIENKNEVNLNELKINTEETNKINPTKSTNQNLFNNSLKNDLIEIRNLLEYLLEYLKK